MDSYNIDEDIIVKWFPRIVSSAVLITVTAQPGKSWYFYFPAWKHFIDPDMGFDGSRVGNIQILVNERLNGAGTALYEKDENPVTEYVIDGVTYYLMTNLSRQVAVWQNGVYDCSITGDISREELIKIVDHYTVKGVKSNERAKKSINPCGSFALVLSTAASASIFHLCPAPV
jgi:hypothetical protein